MQYSRSTSIAAARRQPPRADAGRGRLRQAGRFLAWAARHGYRQVAARRRLAVVGPRRCAPATTYGLFDVNRDGFESTPQRDDHYYDYRRRRLPLRRRARRGRRRPHQLRRDARPHAAPSTGRLLRRREALLRRLRRHGLADADTDGDGVLDGADDQDHDDIPNMMELSRYAASRPRRREGRVQAARTGSTRRRRATPTRYGRVNPFNPCLPAVWSRTCARYAERGHRRAVRRLAELVVAELAARPGTAAT